VELGGGALLVAKFLIENYVDEPCADPEADDATVVARKRIKHLLDNRQIWFIPMVNPDGHYRSMTRDRTWRRNCRIHQVGALAMKSYGADEVRTFQLDCTIDGVDLNRNYPTLTWNQGLLRYEDNKDGTISPNFDAWRGPTPGSELETQAMAKLISEHRFKASISYHNYGRELFYFHDDPYVRHVGKAMRNLINRCPGVKRYQLTDGNKGAPRPAISPTIATSSRQASRPWGSSCLPPTATTDPSTTDTAG